MIGDRVLDVKARGASTTRRSLRAFVRAARRVIPSLLLVGALGGLWQLIVSITGMSSLILPSPAIVASRLGTILTTRWFVTDILTTFEELVLGLGIGATSGIVLGIVMAKVKRVRRLLEPVLVTSQVVPKLALAPLFVIWFGFGLTSKVVLVVLICFFPLVINTLAGLEAIPRDYRELMMIARARRWERLRRLELPFALPYIFTGLRMATVAAVVGAVVSEWIGSSKGLGYLVLASMSVFDTPLTFAVLIVITVLGVMLYGLVVAIERLSIPWHESVWLREEQRVGGSR